MCKAWLAAAPRPFRACFGHKTVKVDHIATLCRTLPQRATHLSHSHGQIHSRDQSRSASCAREARQSAQGRCCLGASPGSEQPLAQQQSSQGLRARLDSCHASGLPQRELGIKPSIFREGVRRQRTCNLAHIANVASWGRLLGSRRWSRRWSRRRQSG